MLLTFEQAKKALLEAASLNHKPLTEKVTLLAALDRVTAEPVISPINVPSFNNSAMDGYAVRLSDINQSKLLPLATTIFAGDDISNLNWPIGTCLRIMTGAPVPDEAEAVVMQEQTESTATGIKFPYEIKSGSNIRYIGEDSKQGSVVVDKGTRLTIATLSNLATLGIAELTVFSKLKVAIFSTGDELSDIGNPLTNNSAIYDSNRFTLKLLLTQLNCQIIDLGIIADDPNLIKQSLDTASKLADLVITSGGVSVGDADYTKTALAELGEINFWKIAIKPGKPFAFGKIGDALFCGLPGNPVSTLVTFYQLVQPLIVALSGQNSSNDTMSFKVKTATSLKKSVGRLDFQRGRLQINSDGELEVVSTGQQGSHLTKSFNHANCFIVLEQDRGNVAQGELVTVELFNSLLK
ncbi:molybdopterin molybdotransferase [Gilliamella apicola]|uniref:Molybdopterin molybdenumtransferase n=1 Tax=Gilliamella apicola TaxID=1196095 RepID=A0A2V4E8X3_9GAMM|nr:molybdopterin molybdotransferase MoeA [Gilliamella apicola]PXZ07521.1 molybdopterin molybdotransferase [Gilliamella apicola]